MIPHIKESLRLCYECNLDGMTVCNMVAHMLPTLQKELASLRAIEAELDAAGWEEWIRAEFTIEVLALLAGIEAAKERLDLVDCGGRLKPRESTTAKLWAAGYGHRDAAGERGRDIFKLDSGEVVRKGVPVSAAEEWLAAGCPVSEES